MSGVLKPVRCGCGGEAKAWEFMNGRWYVKCQKCGIGQFFAYRSEADAIMAWNRAMSGIEKCQAEGEVKTVIKLMDKCLDKEQSCAGCEYTGDTDCLQKLMSEGLYYLRMTLEKSEGRHDPDRR